MKSPLQQVKSKLLQRRNVFDQRMYEVTALDNEQKKYYFKFLEFWRLCQYDKPYNSRVYDNHEMVFMLPDLAQVTPVRYN